MCRSDIAAVPDELRAPFQDVRGWLVQREGGDTVADSMRRALVAFAQQNACSEKPPAALRAETLPADLRAPFAIIQEWLLSHRDGQKASTEMQEALLDFVDLTVDDGGGRPAPPTAPQIPATQETAIKRRKKPKVAAKAPTGRSEPPAATSLSRRDAVLQAILRMPGQKGCTRQIWDAMNGAERKAFTGPAAMNTYCQEQARLYGGTAWLDSSVRACPCSNMNTSASHGDIYSPRGDAPSWAGIDAEEQARLRDSFKALGVFEDGEVNLRADVWTVVVVAMQAMLARRASAGDVASDEADRRGYEKFFEARSIPGLIPGVKGAHRGEFHTLAKMPMHSHGDKMVIVRLHLRHVEDCTAATAREKHYDALGGEACARFLRTKEKQEYNKHRQMNKDNKGKPPPPPAYQYLAIYEIVSIQRVAGGARTTQPHSEPKKRRRGTGAGEQRASGAGDSEESEEEG